MRDTSYQLGLWDKINYPLFSDKPCDQCFRDIQVLYFLCRIQGEHYSTFRHLCKYCRMSPLIILRLIMTDFYKLFPATYDILDNGKAIICLFCGITSFNLNDVYNKYCQNCHIFHEVIYDKRY